MLCVSCSVKLSWSNNVVSQYQALYGYNNMKKFNIAISIVFLNPFTAYTHADTNITGNWYGQRIEQGKLLHWIMENRSDGIYKLYFKECHGDNLYRSQIEAGEWTIEAGIYQTVTKLIIDGKGLHQPITLNKEYIEKYRVLSVNDGVFVYEHLGDKIRYKVIKMDLSFVLDCKSAI